MFAQSKNIYDISIMEKFEAIIFDCDGVHEPAQKWQGARAVASSSSAENLALKLRITRLSSIFDPHVYSADEVAAGKPDPAIYLHAAQQLSISPKHCVAIEDSINGIVSARAAGMRAIGFTEGRHCLPHHGDLLRRAGADAIASSMQELAEHIT